MFKPPSRAYPSIAAYFRANPSESLTAHARMLDLTVYNLCRYKYRMRSPSLRIAVQLAAHFNVPIESLFPLEQPKRKAG